MAVYMVHVHITTPSDLSVSISVPDREDLVGTFIILKYKIYIACKHLSTKHLAEVS